MASTDDKPEPITAPKAEDLLPPPTKATCRVNCFVGDLGLRVLLFAATLVSVVVMVTSKQTTVVPLPGVPGGVRLPLTAKFTQSPATIYFVAALSTACLYSIITMLGSFLAILKPVYSKTILLTFALSDVVILGLVASATGTAGGVAYIGGKGNKHAGWMKLCNNYDKFCNHVTSSIAVSLLAAIVLVLLSALSTFSLYKQIRD